MNRGHKQAWITWSAIGVLAVLCGAVAFLQYRWIGEISEAEQQRLRDDLRERLGELRRHFHGQIEDAARGLQPDSDAVERLGTPAAYSAKYQGWKAARGPIFSRIALAERRGDALDFYTLNPQQGTFSRARVPADWSAELDRLEARLQRRPPGPPGERNDTLLVVPLFGTPGGPLERPPGGPRESGWLLLELNLEYMRATLLPDELRRYLAAGGKLEYHAEVVAASDPSSVIYRSGPEIRPEDADGEIALLEGGLGLGIREDRPPPRGPREKSGEKAGGKEFYGGRPPEVGPPGPEPEIGPRGPGPKGTGLRPEGGRWILRVQYQGGSLEALVAQTRRRNLGVSAGLLALILATSLMLMRYSRRMRELAELQMNFVAGVSHELRTPLTVIRTAAFNLRRSPSLSGPQNASGPQNTERVERYGTLIENESEKLSALVEQVLQFGRASNGHVSRAGVPVAVETLIAEVLEASQMDTRTPAAALEKQISSGLPAMLADPLAVRHALQNLIDNALKHGADEGQAWLGISAALDSDKGGRWIEIRVADHGPGIPREEQNRVFEPFFRGRRAIEDQIHGTGLGLNLVKKIVDGQGGSIRLESTPGLGTTFIVRIPAAAEDAGV